MRERKDDDGREETVDCVRMQPNWACLYIGRAFGGLEEKSST